MGALLMFPSVLRDYTDTLPVQKQVIRIPVLMKQVIKAYEKAWTAKLDENMSVDLISLVNKTDQVHPGIWIGSYSSVVDGTIAEQKIDVVLNMAIECSYELTMPGTQFVKIGIEDGRLVNVGAFRKAAEVIHQARSNDKTVLVHCAAGVSRSVSAVLAYLMLYENMAWIPGLAYVRKSRSCANPHPLLVRSMIRELGIDFIP